MYPNAEQVQAYNYLMGAVPRAKESAISTLMKYLFLLAYVMPALLFLGASWFEFSPLKVKEMSMGFSSILMFLMFILTFFLSLEYAVQVNNPKHWLEMKEKTLKKIFRVKEPKTIFQFFFNLRAISPLVIAYCLAVNVSLAWGGWFFFFVIATKIVTVKTVNAEIALIGQAVIENKFRPKMFAFVPGKDH